MSTLAALFHSQSQQEEIVNIRNTHCDYSPFLRAAKITFELWISTFLLWIFEAQASCKYQQSGAWTSKMRAADIHNYFTKFHNSNADICS
jgi:hypothetical protein